MDWYRELQQYQDPTNFVYIDQTRPDLCPVLLAAQHDRADIVRYLQKNFAFDFHKTSTKFKVLNATLTSKSSRVLQYLLEEYQLSISGFQSVLEIVRRTMTPEHDAMLRMCIDHNLDVRTSKYFVIRAAVSNGLISIIRYIHEKYAITDISETVLFDLQTGPDMIDKSLQVIIFYLAQGEKLPEDVIRGFSHNEHFRNIHECYMFPPEVPTAPQQAEEFFHSVTAMKVYQTGCCSSFYEALQRANELEPQREKCRF